MDKNFPYCYLVIYTKRMVQTKKERCFRLKHRYFKYLDK